MTISGNSVELVGFYGGDAEHALSAWTSTDRSPEKLYRAPEMLARLAKDGHHTPFEKSMLHFLVRTEVATHIQMLKHRIGVSINAESARYKEFSNETYYVPSDLPIWAQAELREIYGHADEFYHRLVNYYRTAGTGLKRAKESARFVLPYGHQLTADVAFNFRSFMHFMGLRGGQEAQMEIRELAQQMLELVWQTGKFDHSLRAFGYGREVS